MIKNALRQFVNWLVVGAEDLYISFVFHYSHAAVVWERKKNKYCSKF